MPQGPIEGPGFAPGGGQSGRPGVAGGTTGQKSFEQPGPDRDEGDERTGPENGREVRPGGEGGRAGSR